MNGIHDTTTPPLSAWENNFPQELQSHQEVQHHSHEPVWHEQHCHLHPCAYANEHTHTQPPPKSY